MAATKSPTPDRPDYKRPELVEILPSLTLMQDLLGGTPTMHAANTTYIRKWTDEDPTVYRIRSRCEQLFEATGRTLSAAVGMMYARPPTLDFPAMAKVLEDEHWPNIDGAGNSGHVFMKRFTDVATRDGVAVILVDMPQQPTDPDTKQPIEVTSQVEEALDLRPRWSYYPRGQALSWWDDTVDNRRQVVQLVLWEPTAVPERTYGVKVVNRFRVLNVINRVAYWALLEEFKESGKADDFRLKGSGTFMNRKGEPYDRLPIGIAHTGRSDALMQGSVPLLGVAQANLGHYQLSTNLRFYLDLLAFPQPTVIGKLQGTAGTGGQIVPGKLKLGPMVVVRLEGEGADYRFTSPSPDAFNPLQKAVERKEWQISQIGMSFLAGDTRAAETAEAKRLDATAENATLSTAAQGVEDAVNEAWVHHAWYEGLESDQAPSVGINRDFESVAMDAQTMSAYVNAVEKAGLPGRLLLEAWQKGGRIPPEVDLEELEMEMLAAQAAKAEEERQAREASLANMQGDTKAKPALDGDGNAIEDGEGN